jgi:hypothetical protein
MTSHDKGRAIGEDTRITTSVKGLAAIIGSAVVVTATVLGMWWDIKTLVKDTAREVQGVQEAQQKAGEDIRSLRVECEAIKPKVEVLWLKQYGTAIPAIHPSIP